MRPLEQRAGAAADPTLDQVLGRLGLAGASRADQRRKVGKLAYAGRLPMAWLRVLREAGFLPYDDTSPEDA